MKTDLGGAWEPLREKPKYKGGRWFLAGCYRCQAVLGQPWQPKAPPLQKQLGGGRFLSTMLVVNRPFPPLSGSLCYWKTAAI